MNRWTSVLLAFGGLIAFPLVDSAIFFSRRQCWKVLLAEVKQQQEEGKRLSDVRVEAARLLKKVRN